MDVPPPQGVARLSELKVADGFLAFITGDAAHVYRDRFATLIGPVSGPDVR